MLPKHWAINMSEIDTDSELFGEFREWWDEEVGDYDPEVWGWVGFWDTRTKEDMEEYDEEERPEPDERYDVIDGDLSDFYVVPQVITLQQWKEMTGGLQPDYSTY